MDAKRFDSVAKLFAGRRSRRQVLAQAGTGLAAGALAATGLAAPTRAQDATPAAAEEGEKVMYLFLQAFQSGSVAPKEGAEGRYTLTLEQGLGQTIYFSDRPERVVGASPTPQFLEGLGFPDDNPPNAALVVETADGQTEIAVVELFSPAYDEATRTATYEVAVLEEWEASLEMGFHQTPADLAAFGDRFGAAHLFIDDCADEEIACYLNEGVSGSGSTEYVGSLGVQGFCYNYLRCEPCTPGGHVKSDACMSFRHWRDACSASFSQCAGGNCRPNQYGNTSWTNGCA